MQTQSSSPTTTTILTADERRTMERISRHLKKPPPGSVVLNITPNVAQTILTIYNKGNRPKKRHHITRYIRDMKEGAWGLTGDTLKFSNSGALRDGQNRLWAATLSKSFKTHVVFGIDDTLFDVMDQGKNRGGEDLLYMLGKTNPNVLAAGIRWRIVVVVGEED